LVDNVAGQHHKVPQKKIESELGKWGRIEVENEFGGR